jgi:hypothetical protein
MTFGAEIWGPALATGAASVAGGLLGGAGRPNQETRMQGTQRKLVDELLASLSGNNGRFSDLFNADEATFQRSFVEPSMARFRNQIAPQIQQQFIQGGQQRGTALEDTLTRAGVDLNSLLDQQYANFQQNAQNNKSNAISGILGLGSGAPNQSTFGQDVMSSLGGYLSAPATGKTIQDLVGKYTSTAPTIAPNTYTPRKGFAPDNFFDYGLGDKRWQNQGAF